MSEVSKLNNYDLKDKTARANHSALVDELNNFVDDINTALTGIDERVTTLEESGGEIDTSVLATVDKIDSIDTYFDVVHDLSADETGITWNDTVEFGMEGGNHESQIQYKLPLIAGDNVSFEVDEQSNCVKVNVIVGSGGGSTSNANAPVLIEVSSVRNDWYDEQDYAPRINVRVVSGTLQEGDVLQLCNPQKKKAYHLVDGVQTNIRWRQRLVPMMRHTITADDITRASAGGSISLLLYYLDDERRNGKIFRYGLTDSGGNHRAPRVLRIVRPNEKGQNIQISNSVRVVHSMGTGVIKVF